MKKILVIQLQRLGDILMSIPALEDLSKRHPDAEIDILINENFKIATPFLSSCNKVIRFNRDQYQEMIGNSRYPFFSPYDQLSKDLTPVLKKQYDEVYNFSHNKISADIMEQVQAEQKWGMVKEANGYLIEGASYQKLNRGNDNFDLSKFHYADYLRMSVSDHLDYRHKERTVAVSEGTATFLESRKRPFIAVQLCSAEEKKNLSTEMLKSALQNFFQFSSKYDVVILGAEFERQQIESFVEQCAELDEMANRVVPHLCSFSDAFAVLKAAKVLVTPDTSVKHLSALAGTPSIEIASGSANCSFTGAYSSGNIVIQPKVDCFPCPHSSGCEHSSYKCKEVIPPEAVALTLFKVIDQPSDLKIVAEEFDDVVLILRSQVTRFGHYLVPLSSGAAPHVLEKVLSKWMSRIQLIGYEKIQLKAGSLSVEFYNMLVFLFGRSEMLRIQEDINTLMSRYITILNDLQANIGSTDYSKLYFDANKLRRHYSFLKALSEEIEGEDLSFGFPQNHNVGDVRKLQNRTDGLKSRLELSLKVLRSIQLNITENIDGQQ